MTQASLVLLVLGATVALFASDRLRVDLVALLSLLGLVAVGAVSTDEALAGFAAPIVLMMGSLFIVGEAWSTLVWPPAWRRRWRRSDAATGAWCYRRS